MNLLIKIMCHETTLTKRQKNKVLNYEYSY